MSTLHPSKGKSKPLLKIVVNVPLSGGKWKVSIGKSTGRHRASPATVYHLIERALDGFLVRELKEKTRVSVVYGHGWRNDSVWSKKGGYLLYVLACFLEDYLEPEFLTSRYNKYQKYAENV